MFGTITARDFIGGMGTDFEPLRLESVRPSEDHANEFLFDFVPPNTCEMPFSVAVRWEEQSRMFSLFLVAATLVPVARYGWLLKVVNDCNAVETGFIARMSLIEPEREGEYLDLAFSWAIKLPEVRHLDKVHLESMRELIRLQMQRFIREAAQMEETLFEAYQELTTH